MTKKIVITGVVQGVGFRPFVYRIAKELSINGIVSNTSEGVVIKANFYNEEHLSKFIEKLQKEKPSNSKIYSIKIYDEKKTDFNDFVIVESRLSSEKLARIPSDLSICNECISDILDKNNRRYLYPFTNCTNCGPRFTITEKIPYDRKNTSMKVFKMCELCSEEYNNPLDRRFHAQPNACPVCGPQVWVVYKNKKIKGMRSLYFLADRIIKGDVVLIKGIGGFHMACDAFNPKSVEKLREIKKREFKPLAVMVDDLKDIEDFVNLKKEEIDILKSPIAPIVMIEKKDNSYFDKPAPLLDNVGVMIAYSPLHRVLFKILKEKGFKNPLVMTSGNFKDEPIIISNDEAIKKFDKLAILCHDREIINRVDDSVGFVDISGNFRLIRRARGYVPNSIRIDLKTDKDLFACGGDIKNVFAFARGDEVFLSQYIGDLDNPENAKYFVESFYKIKKLYDFKPRLVLCDLHPNYVSREISKVFRIKKTVLVQHHVAHVYSVLAENSINGDVLAFAFDGTGYGSDGKIWGGEIFVVKKGVIYRVGHLEEFFISGGDLSIKEVWRIFVSIFLKRKDFILKVLENKVDRRKVEIIIKLCEGKVNGFYTTSFGRLFDAVAVASLGLTKIDFEAEAPMKMESMIIKGESSAYRFGVFKRDGRYLLSFSNFIDELVSDFYDSRDIISTKFHNGVINGIVEISNMLRKEEGIRNVVLCGGVFQNRYILNKLIEKLSLDFNVYLNRETSINDGCISLGQIYHYLRGDKFVF